jgi:hypothetical protein
MTRITAWMVAAAIACTAIDVNAATNQRAFDSAQDAAKALVDAVRAGDKEALLQVVGATSRSWLLTSDEVADRSEWKVFVEAYDRKNALERNGDGRAVLTVGEGNWTFPAPIVLKSGKWRFDTEAGREEILNRRVGRNELDTIQTLLAIVDAQREYATSDPDGNGVRDYAARFASTPGKKDGLHWEIAAGEAPSPLGPLVAQAVRVGYGEQVKAGKVQPYLGYHYRILAEQGPNAAGGAYSYWLDKRLYGGFAVIAYPALYGNSGVRTFIVNHDGVVYEKDLGPGSVAIAEKVTRFDPDKTWTKVP